MSFLSRQRGVSLIEVLVAIVIFSVGVLGVALMQIRGMQYSKQAGSRTTAILQARSLADAMRANPAGVYGVSSESQIAGKNGDLSSSYYLYDGSGTPDPATCGDDACKQARKDLDQWLAQLQAATPAPAASSGGASPVRASVTVSGDHTGTLTIASSWNGMIPDTTSGATHNVSYQFNFQP
jgi:type IV pilus assembly protein PilV